MLRLQQMPWMLIKNIEMFWRWMLENIVSLLRKIGINQSSIVVKDFNAPTDAQSICLTWKWSLRMLPGSKCQYKKKQCAHFETQNMKLLLFTWRLYICIITIDWWWMIEIHLYFLGSIVMSFMKLLIPVSRRWCDNVTIESNYICYTLHQLDLMSYKRMICLNCVRD